MSVDDYGYGANADPETLAQKLKTIADSLNVRALKATIMRSSDSWTTVEVRHAGLYEESHDGWSVEIKHGEL